jgi:Vitamin K-dependent gamma-carboxylase
MDRARFGERLTQFFLPIASDRWLSILRWGLALQACLYALSLRHDWDFLYAAAGGLIDRDLTERLFSLESLFAPRMGWLVRTGTWFGLSEKNALDLIWIALLIASGCLGLGLFCRSAAITAWLLHLCSVKSGGLMSYGADNFTTIGLFYLMVAPLPDQYSLDHQWRKGGAKDPRLHGFFRRVLQLHLCFIYFFAGITKSLGTGWWNGESVWRALTCSPFNIIAPQTLIVFRYFFPLTSIGICLLEIGYPLFIWLKKTRLVWLAGIVGMHIGTALTMGIYLFASIMIILNLAGFGPGILRAEREETSAQAQEGVP